MAEYVILIGFLALTCVVAIRSLGSSLSLPFQHALNGLS
jgi:Flp pilus assembly pilin Flp